MLLSFLYLKRLFCTFRDTFCLLMKKYISLLLIVYLYILYKGTTHFLQTSGQSVIVLTVVEKLYRYLKRNVVVEIFNIHGATYLSLSQLSGTISYVCTLCRTLKDIYRRAIVTGIPKRYRSPISDQ